MNKLKQFLKGFIIPYLLVLVGSLLMVWTLFVISIMGFIPSGMSLSQIFSVSLLETILIIIFPIAVIFGFTTDITVKENRNKILTDDKVEKIIIKHIKEKNKTDKKISIIELNEKFGIPSEQINRVMEYLEKNSGE